MSAAEIVVVGMKTKISEGLGRKVGLRFGRRLFKGMIFSSRSNSTGGSSILTKSIYFSLAFLFSSMVVQAQTSGAQRPVKTVPEPTEYAITQKDANSQVWERTTYEQSPDGTITPHKHSYTELATGLNYQKDGQWVESKEQIDILPNGTAAAIQGQHQAYFPGDIYNGQIELVTPDGKHLKSRPLGLSYDDGRNSALISQLKNSVGVLVGSNQVIYPDAFTDIKADLRYTYTKGGFEQDIILREQPPTPESFGLNPDTARLQVLTEFFDTEEPVKTKQPVSKDGLTDSTLSFGKMKMVQGKAFSMESGSGRESAQTNQSRFTSAATKSTAVAKSWRHLEGRTFLVEELPVNKIKGDLEALPVPATAKNTGASILNKISATRLLPPLRLATTTTTNTIQIAKANTLTRPGYVLDYVALNYWQTDYTFHDGVTYFINGMCDFGGTTTIEGGAIIKFNRGNTAGIDESGPIVCQTTPENLAILTAMDDNSIGETISGSSGTPTGYYGLGIGMDFAGSMDFHDLEIRYADAGITPSYGMQTIRNCRFIKTRKAICTIANPLKTYNVLFEDAQTGFSYIVPYLAPYTVDAQHVTAHNVVNITDSSAITLNTINCLFDNDAATYAAGPAGASYLARCSSYRDIGTTAIDSDLLASIRATTTYAPQDGSYPDTDTPDLGYHYPINPSLQLQSDFWIAFPYMHSLTLSLSISSQTANYGSVSIGGIVCKDFTVAAGTVTTIDLPFEAMLFLYDNPYSAGIENKGIHIVATAPVSVYGLNLTAASSAAFTGYSSQQLGIHYCLMAYTSCGTEGRSQFAVVAASEGTTHVTITPSATAQLPGHTGQYSIDLTQGQTYQTKSMDSDDDVTGTIVTSDKPIAVFAGAYDAEVPCEIPAANPLVQQQLSVDSWGTTAVAIPLDGRSQRTRYRVLSETAGSVTITAGGSTTTHSLSAGMPYEADIDGPVYFQGAQPIQVAQCSNSAQHPDSTNTLGDPCMMLLPPSSFYANTYTVQIPDSAEPTSESPDPTLYSHLNIIVPTSAKASTYVDGILVSTLGTFVQIGGSGYWGAQISSDAGVHSVTSSQPFQLQVFGFGFADAYGYVAK